MARFNKILVCARVRVCVCVDLKKICDRVNSRNIIETATRTRITCGMKRATFLHQLRDYQLVRKDLAVCS